MKIKVIAQLIAPSRHLSIGGANPPLARFEGEIDIELTPALLQDLVSDGPTPFEAGGERLNSVEYSATSNTMSLRGHLRSFDDSYLESLRSNGWVLDSKEIECHRERIPGALSR